MPYGRKLPYKRKSNQITRKRMYFLVGISKMSSKKRQSNAINELNF